MSVTQNRDHIGVDTTRTIDQRVAGQSTSDGAGVRLRRIIGSAELDQLDPFLLFDHFGSSEPQEYSGGFPPHPHRGFDTVTYMLHGRMRHRDSAGNEGVIEAGGVQWMSAAAGVVHSEMPEQQDGRLEGFQLWVNLPARLKMGSPRYQEFNAQQIPLQSNPDGSEVRVVAGTTGQGVQGPVSDIATAPLYLDIRLPAGADYAEPLSDTSAAFIYLIEGRVRLASHVVEAGQLATLSGPGGVALQALESSRLLLIAAEPIAEPVVRGGPFVMNSKEQIAQAWHDYHDGRLGAID